MIAHYVFGLARPSLGTPGSQHSRNDGAAVPDPVDPLRYASTIQPSNQLVSSLLVNGYYLGLNSSEGSDLL